MKPIHILKSFTSLMFVVLMAFIIANLFALPFAGVLIALIVLSFVPMQKGAAFMAVTVEIWQKDIIDNLFKNNEFAGRATSEDQYVIGGKVVHIPVAGVPDKSQKNVTSFPINAVKRTDSEILYSLDNYYQIPKFVEKLEQYELSYDKRQSIMGEQQAQLIQDCMDGLLYRWSLTGTNMTSPGNYVLTTGASTTTDILTGATGGRLTMSKAVFSTVKKAMDNANILNTGRVALLTANHYQQFLDSLSDVERTNFYRVADFTKGVIGTYLGFDIMMRSSVQRWRKTTGIWAPVDEQDPAFAAGVNDSAASIIYQQNAVGRARGDVNVFDSAGRPEYYGDLFSMNMRLGGRQRRAIGVYSIIEDIA